MVEFDRKSDMPQEGGVRLYQLAKALEAKKEKKRIEHFTRLDSQMREVPQICPKSHRIAKEWVPIH
jgi:hypothetical protein